MIPEIVSVYRESFAPRRAISITSGLAKLKLAACSLFGDESVISPEVNAGACERKSRIEARLSGEGGRQSVCGGMEGEDAYEFREYIMEKQYSLGVNQLNKTCTEFNYREH